MSLSRAYEYSITANSQIMHWRIQGFLRHTPPKRDQILSFSHRPTFHRKASLSDIGAPNCSNRKQWRVQGALPAPPTGPNSFIFTHISAERHLRRRSAPPTDRCPQPEILDPQLVNPGSVPVLLHILIFKHLCLVI